MKGTVEKLKTTYGFIKSDNKGTYFFHISDFNDNWEDLRTDFELSGSKIEVTFEVVKFSLKGPRAANVSRL